LRGLGSGMALSQTRLKALLDYDSENGRFRWRINRRGHPGKNKRAGNIHSSGYRHVMINGKTYYAGRLAVLWMIGRWPRRFVDHINCIPDDDRWSMVEYS
jgi:Demerecviridae HNH endonuclease